ncbi:hypothetical protein BGZ94_005262, partial [Podila epigama]
MSKQEPGSIEFNFSPTLYFDDLPNNRKADATSSGSTVKPILKSQQPHWYRAAMAAVPFSEDIFWQVLGRWVMEAPSVVPPVSRVDIVFDTANTSISSTVSSTQHPQSTGKGTAGSESQNQRDGSPKTDL